MKRDFTVYFASDIHGSETCWYKFVNAARCYKANAVVMGGDITGKALVPMVRTPSGRYRGEVLGQVFDVTESELPAVEKMIRSNSFYPYRCVDDDVERLQHDDGFVDAVFTELISEQLARWLSVAQERLEPAEVQCFVTPGNDDALFVDSVLASNPYVVNPNMKVVHVGPYEMLSCGWSPPTPWDSPHECPEEELQAKMSSLVPDLESGRPVVFNLHSPPFETGLDNAPEIREDFSVSSFAGQPNMVPVGSRAVRTLIEEVQPLVSLHGHIHECRGVVKLGRTTCINPGSGYSDGILFGCIVKLRGDAVVSTQLVQG